MDDNHNIIGRLDGIVSFQRMSVHRCRRFPTESSSNSYNVQHRRHNKQATLDINTIRTIAARRRRHFFRRPLLVRHWERRSSLAQGYAAPIIASLQIVPFPSSPPFPPLITLSGSICDRPWEVSSIERYQAGSKQRFSPTLVSTSRYDNHDMTTTIGGGGAASDLRSNATSPPPLPPYITETSNEFHSLREHEAHRSSTVSPRTATQDLSLIHI